MVYVIQLEWMFLQHATKNMRYTFAGVENYVWEKCFLYLFFRRSKYLSPLIRTLSTAPVNNSKLGLQNHVISVNKKYSSLRCASTESIQAVTGESEFSNADHLL